MCFNKKDEGGYTGKLYMITIPIHEKKVMRGPAILFFYKEFNLHLINNFPPISLTFAP
jgi:hypothetical protein